MDLFKERSIQGTQSEGGSRSLNIYALPSWDTAAKVHIDGGNAEYVGSILKRMVFTVDAGGNTCELKTSDLEPQEGKNATPREQTVAAPQTPAQAVGSGRVARVCGGQGEAPHRLGRWSVAGSRTMSAAARRPEPGLVELRSRGATRSGARGDGGLLTIGHPLGRRAVALRSRLRRPVGHDRAPSEIGGGGAETDRRRSGHPTTAGAALGLSAPVRWEASRRRGVPCAELSMEGGAMSSITRKALPMLSRIGGAPGGGERCGPFNQWMPSARPYPCRAWHRPAE